MRVRVARVSIMGIVRKNSSDPVPLEEAKEVLERLSKSTEGESLHFGDYVIVYEKLVVQDVQKEDS